MQLKLLSIKLASIFMDVVILSAYHTRIKFVCCWQHKAKYQINELGSWILIIPSLGGVLSDIPICLFYVVFVQFVRQE